MSLKQSIVIVNEFSVKTPKGGSRGGTPGRYITDYMLRNDAVERVSPAKLNESDTTFTKFEERSKIADTMESVPELKHKVKKSQKKAGTAFGYGEASLSNERVHAIAREFQNQFDYNKKTVLKTVLSFDEKYLREHGLIDEDFVFEKEGDYAGHIDQLKLRMAIMHGLDRMGKSFDNLKYIGAIQVDTKHVHCHLAMMDMGRGHIMPDGTQRGKLTANQKKVLRRNMENYLDEKQSVKMLSSSIMHDKRNVLHYVKKFTHKTMESRVFPQFLLACLPEDKRLWRAGTNRKDMKQANALVREYVVNLFNQPNSGYRDAVTDIMNYADYRKNLEGLSDEEYNKLVRTGQNDLIERCMNSVYEILKKIPKEAKTVETPFLNVMSMDYDSMAAQAVNDPLIEFGFRSRSYATRLKYHRKEYHKYREESNAYDLASDKSEDAKPLGDFLKFERDYHAMLMSKYLHFMAFLPSDAALLDEFQDLMGEYDKFQNLQNMVEDKAFNRLSQQSAEEYGLQVYGQYGGGRVKSMPEIMQERVRRFSDRLHDKTVELRAKFLDYGFDFDPKERSIVRKDLYDFDAVKVLDLHHMGYDFPYDADISKVNLDRFLYTANRRSELYQQAVDYLNRSGQMEAVNVLDGRDIGFMKLFADKISKTGYLPCVRPASGTMRRVKTVSLDNSYLSEFDMMVKSVIHSVSEMSDMTHDL